MDPNDVMKVVGETAGARAKFYELIAKMFEPQMTKKQADANIYSMERYAQFIRDNPDMDIILQDNSLTVHSRTPEAILARANRRMLNEAIQQEENIENIIDVAANELQTVESEPAEYVDNDWISRFFDAVKNVSKKEMQFIWGKILAGEVQKPGSFSLRTLDAVRNLSKEEAEAFQSIVPLVLKYGSNCFVYRDTAILEKYGCLFSHLLTADESGLVRADGFLSQPIDVSYPDPHVLNNGENAIIIETIYSDPTNIQLNVIPLTQAGCELYSVLKQTGIREYCEEIAELIRSNNSSTITVSVHEYCITNE